MEDHLIVLERRTRKRPLRLRDHMVHHLCDIDEAERAHLLAHLSLSSLRVLHFVVPGFAREAVHALELRFRLLVVLLGAKDIATCVVEGLNLHAPARIATDWGHLGRSEAPAAVARKFYCRRRRQFLELAAVLFSRHSAENIEP